MPAEVLNQVRALMREGYSESRAYAIAVANYKRRHGHPPEMHHKQSQEIFFKTPATPEMLQWETLKELQRIRESLERMERKQ